MMELSYSEGVVSSSVALATGESIDFRMTNYRQERTGAHALISIHYNGKTPPLAYDTFNVGRSEERRRLAKAAYTFIAPLPVLAAAYPFEALAQDLDGFCWQAPQVWAGAYYELTEYDPTNPLPPLNFVLYPYILQDEVNILFGPPGSLKSYFGLLMGCEVLNGWGHFWHTNQHSALYINLERSKVSVERRYIAMVNILAGSGIPYGSLPFLHASGVHLSTLRPRLSAFQRQHENPLFILDSISRTAAGSLKEDDVMNLLMDMMKEIGGTWLVLGHSPRNAPDKLFGSQMQYAAAGIMTNVVAERRDSLTGACLSFAKGNDLGAAHQQYLAFEFSPARDDDPGSLIHIRKAREGEFPELLGNRPISRVELIRGHLLAVGSDTTKGIAEATGISPSNVSNVLVHSGLFLRLPRKGKEVFYAIKSKDDYPDNYSNNP